MSIENNRVSLPEIVPINPQRRGPNGEPITPWRRIIIMPERSDTPLPLISPPEIPVPELVPNVEPELVPEAA